MVSVARWFAAHLEQGTLLPHTIAAPLAASYAFISARTLARPVNLPSGTPVVGIGGAVLGGAGKTPVAIAYASALANQGLRVALLAHGYRAHASTPHRVSGQESVLAVGDDALVAARALADHDVSVWVGCSRDETLSAASRHADVIVVDGLLQSRPRRLARSVLVLDAAAPFGSGVCPPAGDLRGPIDEVIALCDEAVLVTNHGTPLRIPREVSGVDSIRVAQTRLEGASERNHRLSLESLSSLRVGLLTMIARPDRVRASLQALGIRPVCVWQGADHGTPSRSDLVQVRAIAREYGLDAWLVTHKCVTHWELEDVGCRLLVLEVTTRLDPTPQPVLDSPPCVPEDS